MKTYELGQARLEIYDKLAESQQEVESGAALLPLDEVFAKYQVKYGVPKVENI
jgi:hypothetical protein